MKNIRMLALLCGLVTALSMTACFGDSKEPSEDDAGKSAADQVAKAHGTTEAKETEPQKAETEPPVTVPAETEPVKTTEPPKESEPPIETTEPAITEPVETEPVTEAVTAPETEPVQPVEPVTSPDETLEISFPDVFSEIEETLPGDGTLSSSQSKNLVLSAYYAISENVDGSIGVTVDISLSSYEIYVGTREDGGMLTVGEESIPFSTGELSNNVHKRVSFPLTAQSFTLPAGTTSFPISAQWSFNGHYGNADIGDLTLGAVIVLSQDEPEHMEEETVSDVPEADTAEET